MCYTWWTVALLFVITHIAFFQPVFFHVWHGTTLAIIFLAFMELGLIVSCFLTCKYRLCTVFPLTFFTSVIISYFVLYLADLDSQKEEAMLMTAVCLPFNILLAMALCCHIRRQVPKSESLFKVGEGDGVLDLELSPGRSYSEYLFRSKSASTINIETELFDDFVSQIAAEGADYSCHAAGFFEQPREA